jgi:hypothetical protein
MALDSINTTPHADLILNSYLQISPIGAGDRSLSGQPPRFPSATSTLASSFIARTHAAVPRSSVNSRSRLHLQNCLWIPPRVIPAEFEASCYRLDPKGKDQRPNSTFDPRITQNRRESTIFVTLIRRPGPPLAASPRPKRPTPLLVRKLNFTLQNNSFEGVRSKKPYRAVSKFTLRSYSSSFPS